MWRAKGFRVINDEAWPKRTQRRPFGIEQFFRKRTHLLEQFEPGAKPFRARDRFLRLWRIDQVQNVARQRTTWNAVFGHEIRELLGRQKRHMVALGDQPARQSNIGLHITPCAERRYGNPAGDMRKSVVAIHFTQGSDCGIFIHTDRRSVFQWKMTMLAPALRRKNFKPEDRRNQLLDCAGALFAEKGYDATTIAEVIQAAEVSKGGFYHHFDSKEALLEGLAVRFTEETLTDIATVLSDEEIDPFCKLDRVLRQARAQKARRGPEIVKMF